MRRLREEVERLTGLTKTVGRPLLASTCCVFSSDMHAWPCTPQALASKASQGRVMPLSSTACAPPREIRAPSICTAHCLQVSCGQGRQSIRWCACSRTSLLAHISLTVQMSGDWARGLLTSASQACSQTSSRVMRWMGLCVSIFCSSSLSFGDTPNLNVSSFWPSAGCYQGDSDCCSKLKSAKPLQDRHCKSLRRCV